MTKRSTKYHDSDDELSRAEKDPNAIIHYNHDGSYAISYRHEEQYNDRAPPPPKDYFDTIYNIRRDLQEYCKSQGLLILDKDTIESFSMLIYEFIPKTRPEELKEYFTSEPNIESDDENDDGGWTVVKH